MGILLGYFVENAGPALQRGKFVGVPGPVTDTPPGRAARGVPHPYLGVSPFSVDSPHIRIF